jgi:signal transduction histidine kinase
MVLYLLSRYHAKRGFYLVLDLIINYANLISKERDIHSIIETIAKFGRDITKADRCSIWLINKDKQELNTIVAQDIKEKRLTIPIDKGIVGESLKRNTPLIINDVTECIYHNKDIDNMTGYKTYSVIALPISDTNGTQLGAIQVINKKDETKSFDNNDLDYLKVAASYIGETLETLFLRQELKNKNRKLSKDVAKKREELNRLNKELEKRIEEEKKKLEYKDRQLLNSAKAAQMGEMISVIAHEWKQPLANIYALASVNLEYIDEDMYDCKNASNNFLFMETKIKYLSETIDDFRNFFNPYKEIDEFDIDEAINKAKTLIEKEFLANHIYIEYNNRSQIVKNYKNEIVHVLINLLNNAKDAIILNHINNGKIIIDIDIKSKFLVVSISDNGGGIAKNIKDEIFKPYFSTKRKDIGTGIGLYLSKKIIEEKCKGRLYADNTKNGAIFYIALPI